MYTMAFAGNTAPLTHVALKAVQPRHIEEDYVVGMVVMTNVVLKAVQPRRLEEDYVVGMVVMILPNIGGKSCRSPESPFFIWHF